MMALSEVGLPAGGKDTSGWWTNWPVDSVLRFRRANIYYLNWLFFPTTRLRRARTGTINTLVFDLFGKQVQTNCA